MNGAIRRHANSRELVTDISPTVIGWKAQEESPLKKRFRTDSTVSQERCFQHPRQVLANLNELRRKGQFCDVTVQVDQTKIPAHRAVLVSSSPYFRAMFCSPVLESYSECVMLKDVDGDALVQLMEFMYTGEIRVDQENVESLLSAATLLQVSFVQDACCRFLESQLQPGNCLGIARFAKWHNCTDLVEACSQFLQHHFSDVVHESDEFVALPANEVEQLISSDRITASEDHVFEGVCRWLGHDVDNRRKVAMHMFAHVRFELLSRYYLTDAIQSNAFLDANPWCKDIVLELTGLSPPTGKQMAALNQAVSLSRASELLMVLAGLDDMEEPPVILRFEFPTSCMLDSFDDPIVGPIQKDMEQVIPDLPRSRWSFGIATLQQQVYVIGGSMYARAVNFVDVYAVAQDAWNEGPELQQKRSELGVAVLKERIYAVGGYDDENALACAEVFDIRSGTWQYIAPMSSPRRRLGVTSLGDRIYAVGGYFHDEFLSTAEYYDPSTNSWTSIANMQKPRRGLAIAALDNRLYVFGGETYEKHDVGSIERYSPEKDTWNLEKFWLVQPRFDACAVVHRGVVYVMGGSSWKKTTDVTESMEMFDPRNDGMSYERYDHLPLRHSRAAIVLFIHSNYQGRSQSVC